jgi:hypothetical protein
MHETREMPNQLEIYRGTQTSRRNPTRSTPTQELVSLLNALVGHLAFQSGAPEIERVFEELRPTRSTILSERRIWHEYFLYDP